MHTVKSIYKNALTLIPVHVEFQMKTIILLILTLISLLPLSSESSVFLPECSSDHSKFCDTIKNPKSKITQCLLEHNDYLSDSCKSSLKTFTESVRTEMKSYCMDDVSKFCRWVIPGGGRIIECLFKNEVNLSQACRKALLE